MEVLEEPRIVRHRLTVEDYHRMADVGVLAADAKLELIDGEIIDMAPTGSRHYWAVVTLNRRLQQALGDAAIVAVQAPLQLDALNQPEPDLVVLRPSTDLGRLPTASDALLVIEVSDTTLAYDVRIKMPLYARHGVPELWVLDLAGAVLRRYAGLQDGSYSDVTSLAQPGVLPLPGLPGCSLDLSGTF